MQGGKQKPAPETNEQLLLHLRTHGITPDSEGEFDCFCVQMMASQIEAQDILRRACEDIDSMLVDYGLDWLTTVIQSQHVMRPEAQSQLILPDMSSFQQVQQVKP